MRDAKSPGPALTRSRIRSCSVTASITHGCREASRTHPASAKAEGLQPRWAVSAPQGRGTAVGTLRNDRRDQFRRVISGECGTGAP